MKIRIAIAACVIGLCLPGSVAMAATCSASCENGTTVSCSGTTCTATDNVDVRCETTVSCGTNCTTTTVTTKTCSGGSGDGGALIQEP